MNLVKTAISQRWDDEFLIEVKEAAMNFGMSMTQFTLEALEIWLELSKSQKFRVMPEIERKKLVMDAANKIIKSKILDEQRKNKLNLKNVNEVKKIKDKVSIFLVDNPMQEFTTNEIAVILKIPQATARTYVRDIHTENPSKFILLRGRPNKIYYNNKL